MDLPQCLPDVPCLTNPNHSYSLHSFHPPPSHKTALPLYIRPCLANNDESHPPTTNSENHHRKKPPHNFFPPPSDKALRIQIDGPLLALQKLLPKVSWYIHHHSQLNRFPQAGGIELAKLAFREIYQRDARDDVPGDMVLRDEYAAPLIEARPLT